MVYTIEERVEIVFIYGRENKCARRTAAEFNLRYPEKNVSHQYVIDLIGKFVRNGSVNNQKRSNVRKLNEETQVEVLGNLAANPSCSLRTVAANTGLSLGAVHKVAKLHKFHPYKLQIHQELGEDDFDRRTEFCEIMTTRINDNPLLLQNICFSDESTFSLNGAVNRHNCRYWSDTNPHVFRQGHTQYPEKLNVWAGILGNQIIGPIFIEGNLNGEMYHNLLEDNIDPLITEAVENQVDYRGNEMLDENLLHFQQDGAPPHYVVPVRQWLDRRFPGRWIGRRGAVEWPARSPDLTPLDFFLWGHLKSVVYKTKPDNLNDLRQRIINECRNITPVILAKVRSEFENRLYHCLERNGAHFEHLL